jgi:predicted AAA+ superfamily ATPase
VNIFARSFDTYLYLNLENEQAAALFDSDMSIDNLLTAIYLYCNKPRTKNKTLLFIDEIQNSSAAVAKLRYFYEEASDIHVIAAGSLLESLIDVHVSFPVGRVEYMSVRPCTFSEFLGAMGETELEKALKQTAIPEPIHAKTMDLFNTYTLIGGMPEVVAHYAEHRDLVTINDIYESLLAGYKDDVEKYARNELMQHIIRYILQEGWRFAAQRISLGCFAGSSYKSREMGEAFRTLEKTMLLELVYPTTDYSIPISTDLKRAPKLIWCDTGLVNYSAKIQKEVFGAKDILDAWRGNIAEHIVAQELLALDSRVSNKRNFWVRNKKGSDAEVDFVLQYDNRLIPIEVKSGHNAKLKSLQAFMDETNHTTAVRVWSNAFSVDKVSTPNGKEFLLYNIPFYYVGQLPEILKNLSEN